MCTELYLISKESNLLSIRNLDWMTPIDYAVAKIKKSNESKYSYMHTYAFGKEKFFVDGMNSAGLMMALLWQAESVYAKEQNDAVEVLDIPKIILGQCSTIEEVREKLEGRSVFDSQEIFYNSATEKEEPMFPTVHFSVHDSNHKSIIIEFQNGVAKIHTNKYQVMTNEPLYDWHVRNVQNYLSCTNEMIPKEKYTESDPVWGCRLIGIPGDFTSHSRFIKIQRLVSFAKEHAYSDVQTMALLDKIIGNVNVPRDAKLTVPTGSTSEQYDITQYTIIKDQKQRKFYIRTLDSIEYEAEYVLDV